MRIRMEGTSNGAALHLVPCKLQASALPYRIGMTGVWFLFGGGKNRLLIQILGFVRVVVCYLYYLDSII